MGGGAEVEEGGLSEDAPFGAPFWFAERRRYRRIRRWSVDGHVRSNGPGDNNDGFGWRGWWLRRGMPDNAIEFGEQPLHALLGAQRACPQFTHRRRLA